MCLANAIEKEGKRFTFEIPGKLPGLNEIVDAARGNKFIGAAQKKRWTGECAQWVIVQRVPVFRAPVNVSFDWIESDERRDVDNISVGAKFILDALVITGRLKDDSRKFVRSIAHAFPDPDRRFPRVRVTIAEIMEGLNA